MMSVVTHTVAGWQCAGASAAEFPGRRPSLPLSRPSSHRAAWDRGASQAILLAIGGKGDLSVT